MSSQSPLEVYESAITNEKRPCRELAIFEAQPPLFASLASCGYGIVSGRLRSNAENALRPMLLSCGIIINNSKFVEIRSKVYQRMMMLLMSTGSTQITDS
ncbi:hypothetical protein IG631_06812 [Alternaria alternata]|nr:hypothetical protein IG631_06812 [Alternaria alternata]